MKCHVFKHRRRVNGKSVPAKFWSGRYRLDGDIKDTTVALGISDKQVAEAKLREIFTRKQKERLGLAPSEAAEKAAQLPLLEHVAAFVADRERVGRSPEYARQLRTRLGRLIQECGWKRVADISAESFSSWRLKQRDLTQKTLNEYLDTASGFAVWLMKHRRCLAENPLRYVERLSTVGGQRFERRALSGEEIERLLAVAGPHKEVYQVAIYLGLRKKEMSLLQWRDIDLEREKPCITLRASTTKNRKGAVRRLHPVAAQALSRIRERRVDTGPLDLVFAGLLPTPAQMRDDLKQAEIPHDSIRRVDFHSLRHTTITLLVSQPGIAPRTVMEVARHGSIGLTDEKLHRRGIAPHGGSNSGHAILRRGGRGKAHSKHTYTHTRFRRSGPRFVAS